MDNPLKLEAMTKFNELWSKVPLDILADPDMQKAEDWVQKNYPSEYKEWMDLMDRAARHEHNIRHHNN